MSNRQEFRLAQVSAPWCVIAILFMFISPAKSDELEVLLKLKSFLIKNSRTNVFASWTKQNKVCSFTGVTCNSNGFVVAINLSQQGLDGKVPFDAVCGFQFLESFSLGTNSLSGRVTDDLKNCTGLKVLDLGENSFTGNLPDLSSLSKLEFLNLNNSGFSGSFPWHSLVNLTNLQFLSLGDNPFDQTSSFPIEVTRLDKLYWLYLTNCSIKGQIPEEISNLTLLKNLELSDNQLFGEIPSGIGKLNKLWQLELYNNSLTGKFPMGFGNLTNLVNFDASHNMLEGNMTELKPLTKLGSLQLFENRFSGEIPEEFGELKNLYELSLYRNMFTGQLPLNLGTWADFRYIDVSENLLTGAIPPKMCNHGSLVDLLILQNKFTGKIPESYSDCKSLNRLRVNNNSLSGFVPSGIWGLPNLSVMDLSLNQFEGPMTPEIGKAKSLGLLILDENKFSGYLPESISNASSLVSIHMSYNQFSGGIPNSIGELKKLIGLYLDENNFSGEVPDSLGSCVSLTVINLSGNSFSSEIPESLGSLPNLNSLNLSNNHFSGEVPGTLSSRQLSNLDLSNNQLTGPIPRSLAIEAFHDSFNGNPGLCSQNLKYIPSCSSSTRTKSNDFSCLQVLLSCFAAGILVLVILGSCFLLVKSRKNNLDRPLKSSSWNMKSFRVLNFSEKDVINAVKSENLIGKGGSGNVYKVVLGNGKELAVKHIWAPNPVHDLKSFRSTTAILSKTKSSRSREYDAEVATLSAVRHVNVVKLYCSITSEDCHLLVYEYLPNGSLWDRLHSCHKMCMGWELRYSIALGAAKGLEYLHHGFDRPVIHRDVKSSNILLDEQWKPRIADFGLAKIVQANGCGDWTPVIAGTHGYMPPEYAYTCNVTEKSDVYSFGVVLMELLTGKRPTEPEFGENKDIVNWVWSKCKSKESMIDVIDSNISQSSKEDALKVLKIATHCTSKMPSTRPSMRTVVQMLEKADPRQLTDITLVDHKEGRSSLEE